MEHESNGDTNYKWGTRYSHQKIDKETGGLGNKSTSRVLPNIIKISQTTEKNPGYLRRLVVTQTPVEGHQLMLA